MGKDGGTEMKDYKKLKANKKYTTAELYEEIKDCSFTAGKPEYKEIGILKYIKLPAVGRYCMQIVAGGDKIQISITQDMGQTETYIANSMVSSKLESLQKHWIRIRSRHRNYWKRQQKSYRKFWEFKEI